MIKLDQKEFIQKSNEILSEMNMEELRRCLINIVRKVPESERETFLQLMYNSCYSKYNEKDDKRKRLICDEKVNEMMNKIKDAFERIENGDLYISASGYEDYSYDYWDSDWVWEYKDTDDIGNIIEEAVSFAHDCINDCRYKEALSVFDLVMNTPISVMTEGGDIFELDIRRLVVENLAGIDLRKLALGVLYTVYQLQPPDKRAASMYTYFSYPYFGEIHIEDIFSTGIEELKDADIFWQSWIDMLMHQEGEVAARLLKEAILYYKGIPGIQEMARLGYKEHPSLFLAAILECEKAQDYEKMREIGIDALEKLEHDLKIRGEIAIKTAQAAYCVNDKELMRKCWYDAFYSNSTIANYLRLFADEEAARTYKDLAIERIEKLQVIDRFNGYHDRMITETAKNSVSEIEYKCLCFFLGYFDRVRNWCMEQKNPLGWSGKFIGIGINLILLHLYSNNYLRTAVKEIAARVSNEMGFNESKNLVFMNGDSVFEANAIAQKADEIFWNIFSYWKAHFEMPMDDKKYYVDWLESVIDKRISAIIDGKYRRKYGDVALLVAALGEVKESLGMSAKYNIIKKYMDKYSRYSAFRGALKSYA